ncbi:LacI family DNA-binding transcriptional regulator [Nocardioides alpinus]|nr:LacI family DNA-binding transcriptional regulator [Nocardioides alpinus]
MNGLASRRRTMTEALRRVIHGQASVKDVARRAGVSAGTVSNVLNRPQLVHEVSRRRVEQAMVDLGFVRNESARQLRGGLSRTLGYVMLDAANPFFTDVANGADHVAEERGLSLFLCNSRNTAARERALLRRLEEQRVQGVLVTPTDSDSPWLAELAGRGTPLVIVDRTPTSGRFCSVSVDDVRGGRLAVGHLVALGHRRVAYVGGPDSLGQVRDRLVGARLAWQEAGLRAGDLRVIRTSDLGVADGRSAGERLAGLPRDGRPTAAFCANDLVALGLLQQANLSGLRVPEDLAIVGYDDIDFAAAAAVPLTSVRQPRLEMGRTAARMLLLEAEEDQHQHEQVEFVPDLVVRRSTKS